MISIVSPWYFMLLLPGLAALLFVYRKYSSEQKIRLGTLMFLEKLEEKSVFRKKVRLPLRFFVELLLLALLIAALSGISIFQHQEIIAVVVDTSESMGHMDEVGKSRLESCIEQMKNRLAIESSAARYRLFTTAPTSREITSQPISREQVISALNQLEPVASEGELFSLGHQLGSGAEITKIITTSDRVLGFGKGAPTIYFENLEPRIETEDASNLAITSIQFLEKERRIEGEAKLFGGNTGSETLFTGTLSRIDITNGKRARWKNIESFSERMKEGVSHKFQIENVPVGAAYHLDLRIAGQSDSLEADSEAWIITERGLENKVAVYSPRPIDTLGLPEIPSLQFVEVSEDTPKNSEDNFRSLISYQQRHSRFIDSGLYILPVVEEPELAQLIRPAGKVLRTQANHPLLDYLDLQSLAFNEVIPLQVPEWGAPLIEVEAGVIAFAGIFERRPIVAFGFEIFPLDYGTTPVSSIFFLNAMKWLASSGDAVSRELNVRWPSEFADNELLFVSARDKEGVLLRSEPLPVHRGLLFSPNGDPVREQNFFAQAESNPSVSSDTMPTIEWDSDALFPLATEELGDGEHSTRTLLIWAAFLLLLCDCALVLFSRKYVMRGV